MRIKNFLLCSVLAVIFLSGCAPMSTKLDEFPLMYEEQPVSILILPPINESTAADAKEYYSTTIQEPLALSGYYTLPYTITTDILKREGVYDSELLVDVPLSKFKEYFGADAVLFTTIKRQIIWRWRLCLLANTMLNTIRIKT